MSNTPRVTARPGLVALIVLVLGLVHPDGGRAQGGSGDGLAELVERAQGGDAEAQYNLGVMYDNGEGVAENPKVAFRWYYRAGQAGHVLAQATLGGMYMFGEEGVVGHNPEAAFRWFSKAAEGGNVEAQHNLGVMYRRGVGVDRDLEAAFEWHARAAEGGNVEAQATLGVMYLFRDELYRFEEEAVASADPEAAFEWFSKAAEGGDVEAQHNLAWMYRLGLSVGRDLETAFEWYARAAEAGHADARFHLGWMYRRGVGTIQDEAEALVWFNVVVASASSYDKKAIEFRDALVCDLGPQAASRARARAWEILQDLP